MSKKRIKTWCCTCSRSRRSSYSYQTSQENKEIKATKAKKAEAARLITATQNAANMKRTAKVFIIQTVTTKHSPVRKSQKASMTKTLIS